MTYIIAEIGCNHNGSLELAKEMTIEAAKCGVDCVKFQTFKAESITTVDAKLANYQQENGVKQKSQFEMIKQLELTIEDFKELQKLCKELNVDFLSTPFDLDSIDDLAAMGINTWKIPSGEITNYPYIKKIAQRKEKVILSTGMCTVQDIESAVEVLTTNGVDDITILHCNTQYPTPIEDANLKSILFLKKHFPQYEIGYSDHTLGTTAPLIAVSLGSTIIEKHFTTDKTLEGPDHAASADVSELKEIVSKTREIEKMLGQENKFISESEKENIAVARKSIVAKTAIKKGEILTEDNLCTKRPGSGISPMQWNHVVGTPAIKDFVVDELIVIE